MAGPAELLKIARKPHCDWGIVLHNPVAVRFACIFQKLCWACYVQMRNIQVLGGLGEPPEAILEGLEAILAPRLDFEALR